MVHLEVVAARAVVVARCTVAGASGAGARSTVVGRWWPPPRARRVPGCSSPGRQGAVDGGGRGDRGRLSVLSGPPAHHGGPGRLHTGRAVGGARSAPVDDDEEAVAVAAFSFSPKGGPAEVLAYAGGRLTVVASLGPARGAPVQPAATRLQALAHRPVSAADVTGDRRPDVLILPPRPRPRQVSWCPRTAPAAGGATSPTAVPSPTSDVATRTAGSCAQSGNRPTTTASPTARRAHTPRSGPTSGRAGSAGLPILPEMPVPTRAHRRPVDEPPPSGAAVVRSGRLAAP